jgi:hypothetical protein
MRTKTSFAGWLSVAASLCAASNVVHAANQATFTDSWKDAPVAVEYPETTGSFSFKITLPLDGELTVGSLDENSQFSVSIGPTGSPLQIVADSLGDAVKFTASASGGSATFPVIPPSATNLTAPGDVTVSWTATTLTVSGSFAADFFGEEALFAASSDGTPADNTFAKIIETNEVSVTLDASDNGGGTFSFDNASVPGTVKNTETEQANPGGTTIALEAGTNSGAATGISFTDTWKDAGAPMDYAASTGSFSFKITLPVDGELKGGDLDAGSQFSLNIGPTGSPLQIVSDTLGDASKFTPGASGSAVFAVIPPNSTNQTAAGKVTVSWTAATITVSGSFAADIFGFEESFLSSSDGIPADNTFARIIETNEVSVVLDASDNGGETFGYDNTNVLTTIKNTETEHTNPDGTVFPLESGSASVATTAISFTDSWKDTATTDYQAGTTGSGKLAISLPWVGVPAITSSNVIVSDIDSNSLFSISIGAVGNPLPIVPGPFSAALKFTTNKNGGSALFPILLTNGQGDMVSNGNLTVSWTATNIAVTAACDVDFAGEEAYLTNNSDGMPGTQSLSGISEITLVLGDNNGGLFTYDNTNVPLTGKNTQTIYTNGDGTTFLMESGSMTGAADFTPPKVAITSPKAGFAVYNANSIITLEGTASDNVSVASIQYYLNGDTANPVEIDSDELPTNSLAWTNEVDFSQPPGHLGTNVVTVFAVDTSGNVSSNVSRTFLWISNNAATVSVNPPGAGTVKGITNGQTLQVGSGHNVTATPANKTWIFSQWTDGAGDVLSSSQTYDYIDTNGTLTANFVNNPFTNATLAGSYAGLFFDASGVEPIDAGSISLKVTGTGGYSGQIYIAPTNMLFSFSGQLAMSPDDSTAGADFTLKVSKTEYLDVNLEITNLSDPDAAMLGGSVAAYSDSTETNLLDTANIQGKLCLNNTNVVPGLYNVDIPGSPDPSQAPGGYSFGTATVSSTTKGAVSLVLDLADGTSAAVSSSSSMALDGTCPFYDSLYGGKGAILGWLQFATNGSGAVQDSSSWWVKEPVADKYYTNGFRIQEEGSPSGARYLPAKAGTNLFGATALTFVVDGGFTNLTLPNETDFAVTYNPAKNTFTDTSKVTVALTNSTGRLSGSFYPTNATTPLSFRGLMVGGVGVGFYADTNYQTGPVSIINNQ